MPLYTFRCEHCRLEVELLRSFVECRRAPETAELTAPDGDDSQARCGLVATGPLHQWTKVIHPPRMARGASWGGSKGNW